MAFKVADPRNDKERHVVRKSKYHLFDFWKAGMPGEGFIITGGREDEQIWGLYHAVEDYIQRKQRPVVILHNNIGLDATFQKNLLERFPGLSYERIGGKYKNYMPFDGMSKEHIVTCIENQCKGTTGVDESKIGQYTDSLLKILEKYKTSNALCYLEEICNATDAEIIGLAERAGMNQNVKNGIQMNTSAGMEVRKIIMNLNKSFSSIYSSQKGPWINIGRFIKQRTGNRVLSLCIGSVNIDKMLLVLRDELSLLSDDEFLLVLYDIGVNERNGLGEIFSSPQNRFTRGICSAEVTGMFSGRAVEAFEVWRARIKKWMILKYTDAAAARKISNLFSEYMMQQTVTVKAPKKWWEIFFAKAPGESLVKSEVLEAGEICEVGYQNAILYGHSGVEILFVTGKLDYNIR